MTFHIGKDTCGHELEIDETEYLSGIRRYHPHSRKHSISGVRRIGLQNEKPAPEFVISVRSGGSFDGFRVSLTFLVYHLDRRYIAPG